MNKRLKRALKKMSANNQLPIEKRGKNWVISDADADTGRGLLTSNKQYKTLESTVIAVNNYMREHEVEYGLDIRI